MRIVKITFLVLFALFVVVQFFQPEKNKGEVSSESIFKNETTMSSGLKEIIGNSCFDCHSDNTRYLWYHQISPVSWMINNHIVKGKKELNLSGWEKMDDIEKITVLEDIKKVIKNGSMPMKSYLLMHPGAKLSEAQKNELLVWIDKKGDEIINAVTK